MTDGREWWGDEAREQAYHAQHLELGEARAEVARLRARENDLLDAIDHLWAWMPVEETKEISQDMPGLAELCRHAHHRISHEQYMMHRHDWSQSAGPHDRGHEQGRGRDLPDADRAPATEAPEPGPDSLPGRRG